MCVSEGMPLYVYYVMPKRNVSRLSCAPSHILIRFAVFLFACCFVLIGLLLLLLLLQRVCSYWGKPDSGLSALILCLHMCVGVCVLLYLCVCV